MGRRSGGIRGGLLPRDGFSSWYGRDVRFSFDD